jgi:hypothetical protein
VVQQRQVAEPGHLEVVQERVIAEPQLRYLRRVYFPCVTAARDCLEFTRTLGLLAAFSASSVAVILRFVTASLSFFCRGFLCLIGEGRVRGVLATPRGSGIFCFRRMG